MKNVLSCNFRLEAARPALLPVLQHQTLLEKSLGTLQKVSDESETDGRRTRFIIISGPGNRHLANEARAEPIAKGAAARLIKLYQIKPNRLSAPLSFGVAAWQVIGLQQFRKFATPTLA